MCLQRVFDTGEGPSHVVGAVIRTRVAREGSLANAVQPRICSLICDLSEQSLGKLTLQVAIEHACSFLWITLVRMEEGLVEFQDCEGVHRRAN